MPPRVHEPQPSLGRPIEPAATGVLGATAAGRLAAPTLHIRRRRHLKSTTFGLPSRSATSRVSATEFRNCLAKRVRWGESQRFGRTPHTVSSKSCAPERAPARPHNRRFGPWLGAFRGTASRRAFSALSSAGADPAANSDHARPRVFNRRGCRTAAFAPVIAPLSRNACKRAENRQVSYAT